MFAFRVTFFIPVATCRWGVICNTPRRKDFRHAHRLPPIGHYVYGNRTGAIDGSRIPLEMIVPREAFSLRAILDLPVGAVSEPISRGDSYADRIGVLLPAPPSLHCLMIFDIRD